MLRCCRRWRGSAPKLAERIVEHRDAHGRFKSRQQLCKVPKLGPRAFEQAAGFLRIPDGDEPLDNSAVHPESYYVVEKMAARLQVPTQELVGNAALAGRLTRQRVRGRSRRAADRSGYPGGAG